MLSNGKLGVLYVNNLWSADLFDLNKCTVLYVLSLVIIVCVIVFIATWKEERSIWDLGCMWMLFFLLNVR